MKDYNPFSLTGKRILVTGASSGIGRATAVECSRMGASVVLSARNGEALQETLLLLDDGDHMIIPADLTDENQIMDLAETVTPLDGVVHCAGKLDLKTLNFYSSKSTNRICSTNLFSALYLTRDLLKKKKIKDKASIVFISSIAAAAVPALGHGLYSITKAGLDAYMRQCAMELAVNKIRANSIAPGMVETNLNREMIADFTEVHELDKQKYLAKRYGRPEEVAWMAVYLLSDASDFVNGTTMVIDGGRSLANQ